MSEVWLSQWEVQVFTTGAGAGVAPAYHSQNTFWSDGDDETYAYTVHNGGSSGTVASWCPSLTNTTGVSSVEYYFRASATGGGVSRLRPSLIVPGAADPDFPSGHTYDLLPSPGVEVPADGVIREFRGPVQYGLGIGPANLEELVAHLAYAPPPESGDTPCRLRVGHFSGCESDPDTITIYEAALIVTYGPQPEPVFFQSGWVYYDRFDVEQNAYMEDIHVKVMRYLDTLIGSGHNGEVLCIGDYDLREKPFGAGYHLADYLGWPLQVIPSPSDFAISQAEITPIFDQIQAGTYIPRIVYVETSSSGPHLTTDQYLILRDLMDAGQTGLFLQSEKAAASPTAWVEEFTRGTMRHHWSPSISSIEVMLETDLTTGKAYLQDLYDQYSLNGWGWYEPVGIEYADFRSGFAVLESNEVYTGLTGVPASSPVVTGVLGIPALLLLGNPPEQIYPRSDGLGTGSADQVYPIPNTYQASPDHWGGYW